MVQRSGVHARLTGRDGTDGSSQTHSLSDRSIGGKGVQLGTRSCAVAIVNGRCGGGPRSDGGEYTVVCKAVVRVERPVRGTDDAQNRRPVQYSRHASPAVFAQQPHSGYSVSAAAGPSTQTSYAGYPANQSYSKAGGSSTADHSRHTHPEAHTHAHVHAHSTAPARPPQQASTQQQQQQQQQPARPQQSTAQMFNQLASGGQVEHSGSGSGRSGSGGTASQVGQQAQVPRREGRTVPTSSTIFGGLMAKEPVKVDSASAGGTNGLPSTSGSGWGTGLGLGLGGMGGMGGNKLVNGHNKEAVPGSGPGPVPASASVSPSGPGPGARMGAGAGAHTGLGGQSNGPSQPSSATGPAPSTAPTTGDKRPTPPSAAAPERRYGLADYLGGSPSGAFGSFSAGLGKVGVLSPPNVGLGGELG